VRDVADLFEAPGSREPDDPPGYEVPYARIGPLTGASAPGPTVYELAPGQSICPYRYEYPGEKWLVVLEGTVSLRDPEEEGELGRRRRVPYRPGRGAQGHEPLGVQLSRRDALDCATAVHCRLPQQRLRWASGPGTATSN
jgi:hypothetical protein